MDAMMEILGLSTMTHNFFLRAGAHTLMDVVDICEGRRSRKNIPQRCIEEAREAVRLQETFLGIRFMDPGRKE